MPTLADYRNMLQPDLNSVTAAYKIQGLKDIRLQMEIDTNRLVIIATSASGKTGVRYVRFEDIVSDHQPRGFAKSCHEACREAMGM